MNDYMKALHQRVYQEPKNAEEKQKMDQAEQALKAILDRAGCRRVRFHDLRHPFATLPLENEMDVRPYPPLSGTCYRLPP